MNTQPEKSTKWGGARAGAGRPQLNEHNRRRQVAIVRLTEGEKEAVKRTAERSKMGLSDWMRQILLPHVQAS